MTNPNLANFIAGTIEVNFSDEYFLLAKNNWNIDLLSTEQTLLRVYDNNHELCLVTRFEDDKLVYILLFGTYEYKNSKIIHHTDFGKKISVLSFEGKTDNEIFEIIRHLFAERKFHSLNKDKGEYSNV